MRYLALLGLLLSPHLCAQDSIKFVRTSEDGKFLQTAITRYVNGDKTLDTIAAVHIGDASYYQALNKKFEGYDSVLYELVAPENTVPDGRSSSDNPISFVQTLAKNMLELEGQLEKVDYKKKNFVHADLSTDEIQQKMAERGDSATTLILEALTHAIRQSNMAKAQDNETNLSALLEGPTKIKQFMAKQFSDPKAMQMSGGINQLLVEDRNNEAINVLKKQEGKEICIFYGAAHMPDFDKKILALGYERKSQEWVNAWDLTKESGKDPIQEMLKMIMEAK